MIIGSDLMAQIGLDIKYSSRTIEWQGDSIPMKGAGELTDPEKCEAIFFANTQSPILQKEEERQAKILDADYSKVDIDTMVDGLEITAASKEALKTTLKKYPTLFGGGLGLLRNIKPVTIELQPGVKPVQETFYSVPHAYKQALEKEVNRLCEIGVLERLPHDDDSPWASPTFC
mmetsp:Transcript_27043/g.74278  ORF Transcript_27043/g.74278 Transcript_27043/m.74278 type:complete len:174 (-) Transcript_27043:671-1192(-)